VDFLSKMAEWGLTPTPKQLEQFHRYYFFLIEKNQVMNLTAITEESEVYTKHFLDSLSIFKAGVLSEQTLLDVGSGAGFPSIPLKIMFPGLRVTIVDALQKRITFLSELLSFLEISDVELVHGRIEEFERKNHFDIVSARAIAKLPMLCEFCLPFVKKGGLFISMKSIHYEEELRQSHQALSKLRGRLKDTISISLEAELTNILLVFEKTENSSPIYPRSFALMKKKPL